MLSPVPGDDDEDGPPPSTSAAPGTPVRTVAATLEPGVVESLIFAGDGGNPNPDGLELLRAEAALLPAQTRVVYLGDNIYPRGLPTKHNSNYQAFTRILDLQIHAAAGAAVFFVPGNHDWDESGSDGWNAVRRMGDYLDAKVGNGTFTPGGGCPGPAVAFLNSAFKLIALDSEWWLRSSLKPVDASSGCPQYSESGILDQLRKEAAPAAPNSSSPAVIILTHHPFESDGLHGSRSGSPQDAGSSLYREMKSKIFSAIERNPPLICAAGHDHLLQVISERPGCRYYITSGTLSRPTALPVDPPPGSLFASSEIGLVRLDRFADGSLVIKVKTVRDAATGRDAFRIELNPSTR
jgi:hypothetical protein